MAYASICSHTDRAAGAQSSAGLSRLQLGGSAVGGRLPSLGSKLWVGVRSAARILTLGPRLKGRSHPGHAVIEGHQGTRARPGSTTTFKVSSLTSH